MKNMTTTVMNIQVSSTYLQQGTTRQETQALPLRPGSCPSVGCFSLHSLGHKQVRQSLLALVSDQGVCKAPDPSRHQVQGRECAGGVWKQGHVFELVGFGMLHVEMGNELLNERLRKRGPLSKPHRWSTHARGEESSMSWISTAPALPSTTSPAQTSLDRPRSMAGYQIPPHAVELSCGHRRICLWTEGLWQQTQLPTRASPEAAPHKTHMYILVLMPSSFTETPHRGEAQRAAGCERSQLFCPHKSSCSASAALTGLQHTLPAHWAASCSRVPQCPYNHGLLPPLICACISDLLNFCRCHDHKG